MSKWLSKGGLSAIAKDVFGAPVNFSKTIYNAECKENLAFARFISVGAHLPAAFSAVSVGTAFGPVAGAATFMALTNAFSFLFSEGEPNAKGSFYPAITAHAAKNAPAVK
ncbi:MAG: hypothetical protein H6867_04540 [Rhodospirillales bacterium]|nr:hypothetical protein [Rhodospirillales bacterium]MCB9996419.1 hypothetical protein [Rhodospirillales bacterium]